MYEKLLLVNGGGVTGEAQKGTQVDHEVNFVIGLGGTGKACVQLVKTYAHQRLKANNNGEFDHIRFLVIDSVFKKTGEKQEAIANQAQLTEDEKCPIDYSAAVGKMTKEPWNDWWYLEEEEKQEDKAFVKPLGNGCGGQRRCGRLYLGYGIEQVKNKIDRQYSSAAKGINTAEDKIFFHVVSGMGGGTGSGTFLDMCYFLKKEYPSAKIIGYFFLPKVNSDIVDTGETKEYIRQNGFAAMQDLDYAMRLGKNRGAFSQKNRNISLPVNWSTPPVDMCNIISNKGAVGTGTGLEGYTYAMNVVAEYIMDFLVKSNTADHTLDDEISNKDTRVERMETKRRSGYFCDYSTMGSSSAIVPYREINTYVISNLFSKFSQIFNEEGDSIPSAKDCFNVLKAAFAPNAATFEDLNRAVYQKTASGLNTGVYTPYPEDLTEINWADVETDDDVLKKLRADILIPKPLYAWYNKQYADKTGVITKNVNSLKNTGNQESLINLIRVQLDALTRNIYRGPSYALKTIDAAVKDSLKDVIEGLIAANRTMLNSTVANLSLKAKEYNDAVNVIKKKNAKHKRGDNALIALIAFYNQLGLIDLYEGIIGVLTELKDQLTGEAKTYYARLETVYNELKSRFDSNLKDIESHNSTVVDTSYAEYLVTIDQLKSFLDAELVRAVPNIPNTFESFMTWISDPDHKELLLPEHEDGFIKYMNKFFIDDQNGLFNGLVTMTIDDYLRMAYANDNSIFDWHGVTNDQIKGYVKVKLRNLINNAKPLLSINSGVQNAITDNDRNLDGWITIPEGSAAILDAANEVKTDGLKVSPSDMSDRIFVEMRRDGVALSAVTETAELEAESDRDPKAHLYGGFPKKEGIFNNWALLPPLTPYQLWKNTNARFDDIHEKAKIFDDALENKLIVPVREDYTTGIIIREYNIPAIDALKKELADFCAEIDGYTASEITRNKDDLLERFSGFQGKLNDLFDHGFTINELFDVESAGNNDPIEYRKAFYRDIFVRAPQMVMDVEKQLSHSGEYNAVVDAVGKCQKHLDKKIESKSTEIKYLPIFETALFAGLFTIKGNNITCECKDERTGRELVSTPLTDASKREDFPYSNIPIYQAFLSFMKLDSDIITKIGTLADDTANDMFNPGSKIDKGVESFMGRMSVWYNLAERYSDAKTIIEFLENENQQFRLFKEERGL